MITEELARHEQVHKQENPLCPVIATQINLVSSPEVRESFASLVVNRSPHGNKKHRDVYHANGSMLTARWVITFAYNGDETKAWFFIQNELGADIKKIARQANLKGAHVHVNVVR